MSLNKLEGEVEESQLYNEWRKSAKKTLEYLEDITRNPGVYQEQMLAHILKKNANSVYLQELALNGATDIDTFRKLVPVSDYERILPFVQRIVQGDKAPLLGCDPVVELIASSGTTGGESKLYPITEEQRRLRTDLQALRGPNLNQKLPGLIKGKYLSLSYAVPGRRTEGGLMRLAVSTSSIKHESWRNRPFDPTNVCTTPDTVILEATSYEESTYCHFMCGLLQREEVLRIGAIFASAFVRYMTKLEELWPEICADIANGTLSESRVPNELVREAIQPFLRADPKLAEILRQECSAKSWEGIITKLWPNCQYIDTITTGTMAAYIPMLSHYGGNVQIICSTGYASSEGHLGLALNPTCSPGETSYTLIPTMCYFEFIPVPVDGQEDINDEVLDLTSLKEGQEYELLVTTVFGLYRYRVGDILKVVGFYNAAPSVQFMRRKNTVLSVDTDKTDEQELQTGVTGAAKLLEDQLGLRLQEYTSTVDYSTAPPHYVIFMELKSDDDTVLGESIPTYLLDQCCASVESAFNVSYKAHRASKRIGSLELRIVKGGTFQRLTELAFQRGATPSQYKTPRGLGHKDYAQLQILTDGLLQHYPAQSSSSLPDS
ncbi:hypothetical protein R1flu_017506 [Riccia fluitans]|uniref:Uncharacterized protein n=1 Tax=Riccia fluitans TaxID=41844 RepID=A0ABD1ZD96_9MARC